MWAQHLQDGSVTVLAKFSNSFSFWDQSEVLQDKCGYGELGHQQSSQKQMDEHPNSSTWITFGMSTGYPCPYRNNKSTVFDAVTRAMRVPLPDSNQNWRLPVFEESCINMTFTISKNGSHRSYHVLLGSTEGHLCHHKIDAHVRKLSQQCIWCKNFSLLRVVRCSLPMKQRHISESPLAQWEYAATNSWFGTAILRFHHRSSLPFWQR